MFYNFFRFLIILTIPCNASKRNARGIIDFIINLKGSPPGSGLDSRIQKESSTNGREV